MNSGIFPKNTRAVTVKTRKNASKRIGKFSRLSKPDLISEKTEICQTVKGIFAEECKLFPTAKGREKVHKKENGQKNRKFSVENYTLERMDGLTKLENRVLKAK